MMIGAQRIVICHLCEIGLTIKNLLTDASVRIYRRKLWPRIPTCACIKKNSVEKRRKVVGSDEGSSYSSSSR